MALSAAEPVPPPSIPLYATELHPEIPGYRGMPGDANEDGVVDTIEAAHVLLKMRSLAKTLSAAKNDAC